MDKFDTNNSFIRTRINENLLKVKDESRDIKNLLSLGIQSAEVNSTKYDAQYNSLAVFNDIDMYSHCTSRVDLLRTSILLATSRNSEAQENLMNVIRVRLGKIKDKDYRYIANLIYLKNPLIVEKVNNYLSRNLEGFSEMHRKYYKQYYSI